MSDMPNAYMREVLLRELRAHRVSVDRYAAYLLVMTDADIPCPRCYASGTHMALEIGQPPTAPSAAHVRTAMPVSSGPLPDRGYGAASSLR
jgi:hypothetical protein